MRDARRCALDLLLNALARGIPEAAGPHRARRAGRARGEPRAVWRAQDKGLARPPRHNGQPQANLQDNEGKRLGQRVRAQEARMPSRQVQRGRPAQCGGRAVRRARAAHPRARRRRLELRLPAGRPGEPRDRRAFGGAAQGRRAGEGRVRDARAPLSDIQVFHTDRGSEFDNAKIDETLEAFGIERSLSKKGCPCDNAVDESTNKILKAEFVYRETFGTTRELRAKLADYVHWCNNFRIHSTLGCMTPVEFRKAGMILPESSK